MEDNISVNLTMFAKSFYGGFAKSFYGGFKTFYGGFKSFYGGKVNVICRK